MSWQTFGHENVKRILDLQLQSGQLSHAYLFYGPEGIGKKTLALELAGKILESDERIMSHPDFSILDQTDEIKVEQMQQFMTGLSFKPFVAAKKVAIINNAQLMNTQSSNALLKTLEEPSPSTVLILISSNKNLLSTILSRCQVFSFNEFTKQQLQEFAHQHQVAADRDVLEFSFGRIGRLLELQDTKIFQSEKLFVSEFEKLQKSTEAERLLAIGQFAEKEPQELQKLFTTWLFWQRQHLNGQSVRSITQLLEALRQLETNKNKKLILQDLFLKM